MGGLSSCHWGGICFGTGYCSKISLQSFYLQNLLFSFIFSEMFWSRLPDDWLKGLVKLFHNESAHLIDQICVSDADLKHLQNFLQILQMAYKVPFCTLDHNEFEIEPDYCCKSLSFCEGLLQYPQ